MTQKGFYFDGKHCTGCKTCELACKDYNDLGVEYTYRRIYDYEGGGWTANADGTYDTDSYVYHVSVACNHCENPACAQVCPTTAMSKDADTGLVSVDADRCIGCGYCAMACPYDAPTVDRALGHSVKCDGCKDRVAEGKLPICVAACPQRCLGFGDVDALAQKGQVADVAPLPDPSYTNPHLYVRKVDCMKPCGDTSGHVANPLEVI